MDHCSLNSTSQLTDRLLLPLLVHPAHSSVYKDAEGDGPRSRHPPGHQVKIGRRKRDEAQIAAQLSIGKNRPKALYRINAADSNLSCMAAATLASTSTGAGQNHGHDPHQEGGKPPTEESGELARSSAIAYRMRGCVDVIFQS